MKKFIPIFLSALLLFTGCEVVEYESPNNNEIIEKTPTPTATPKTTPSPTPTPTPTPTPKPKIPSETTGLSRNKLGFGYSPNKDNLPVSIGKKGDDLLTKYNGFFIDKANTKNIYLTMDEGYENGYTASILDTLKAKNVQVTFFITSDYLKSNEALVKRMIDEGHIVGNHSVSHPSLPSISDEKVVSEIMTLHNAVLDKFNYEMKYFRAPMGEYSESVLSIVQSLGYRSVFWSFAYRDWETDKQKGKDNAIKNVMNGIHNGCVLLLHPVSSDNAEALAEIIDGLREKGYVFSTLDNIAST